MEDGTRSYRVVTLLPLVVVLAFAGAGMPATRSFAAGAALPASGQLFTDRMAFEATAGTVTCIDFEGLATGGGQANAVELAGTEFPGVTLTAGAGTSGLYVGIPDPSIPGGNDYSFFAGDFYPTSGISVLATDLAGTPNGQLIVDFAVPTTGVGAYFLDVESGTSSIELFDGPGGTGTSLGTGTLHDQGDGSQSFLGLSATGVRSAVLQIGDAGDDVGLDDLCYGDLEAMVTRTYLPLAARNYDLALPPVHTQNHITGIDGLVTVPLTGGGTAEFRLVDRLEEPVAGVPVLSIENESGVTLLAYAQSQGFFPKLFSAPSSSAAQDALVLARATAAPVDLPLVPLNDEGLHAEEQELIYGHLLSLPQNMEAWERSNRTVGEACEMAGVAVDAFLLAVSYITAPAHLGIGFAAHAVVHVAIVEGIGVPACKALFGPNPVQVHASIENDAMGAYLLDWEATIQNTTGVLFGQVVEAESRDGLSGEDVWLDGSPLSIATTFPNGWYRFDGVLAGQRSVYAERQGYTSDTVLSIPISPNTATRAEALELALTNPGTWRIQNDTGGTLTIDVDDVSVRSLGTGSHDWALPPGTYSFTAWTVGCGGMIENDITVYAGLVSSSRFYCAQTDRVRLDVAMPGDRPILR